jgi:branched-chain amino acid transport system ATP-binding protein
MSAPLLQIESVRASYGDGDVLQDVSLILREGGVLSLLGRNGAGKTSLLKAVMGILPPRAGAIRFAGRDIAGLPPHRIARAGLGYVPETRGIFPSLSVLENLTLAAREGAAPAAERWTLDRVFALFPRLRERRGSGGAKLSGGEQQMLAIARALLTNPRLLLLDEPTEGLAPIAVEEVETVLTRLKATGIAMLLVEQNLRFALAFADEVAVLGKGQVRWHGPAADFAAAEGIRERWLGI